MTQKISLIGVKSKQSNEVSNVQQILKGISKCYEMKIRDERFKLGSLDSMLLNLEKVKKLENSSENFLKRIEKIYAELSPDKRLEDNKLDSNVGPKDIDIFLKKFEWDDIRYPRSASLYDQIKHIEEKLMSMDKNLKIKQQNFHDSKTIISNNFQKKVSLTNFINKDLNETIHDLLKEGSDFKRDIFINSDYLQSYIAFVPKQRYKDFQEGFEAVNDYIVPSSLVQLTIKFSYVMCHFVGFKQASDDIKIQIKQEFGSIVKDYESDPDKALKNLQEKDKFMLQNKTDKELLDSSCRESFKETMVLLIHLKVYLIIIDSSLRFGSLDNFVVILMFFDGGKKMRVVNKLVKQYAEKDKVDYYGTKDQLNDVEDFFPFVWSEFQIEIQQFIFKYEIQCI